MNYKEQRNTDRELRYIDGSRHVVGLAVVFNKRAPIGDFFEQVAPEAIDDDVLNQDVRCLFNHDSNFVLGRTKAGTLKLTKTAEGLEYSLDMPVTTFGNEVLTAIKLGNVSGSSFGFTVKKDEWKELPGGIYLRTILKIGKLFDVSPVTFPAYADTTVGIRSLEAWKRSHGGKSIQDYEQELKKMELEMNRPQPHRTTLAEAERQLKALRP
ncbi:MAG TPA: HK97 family phage prohead protease [Bacteroidales bacterium]|nr:HK97 family phage prohead protease [Bacteroidales bacterium]